jgi:hypothetical protein
MRRNTMPTSPIVVCLYRVRRGREGEFIELLKRHWPTLRSLDLATDDPPQYLRGFEQDGEPMFVEIFSWKTNEGPRVAHEHPDVMAIWEPMNKLTEHRNGRPNMEFPHFERLSLLGAA